MIAAIWNDWLPTSGHRVAHLPNFERYTESFDPLAGTGGRIWVPVKP